MASRESLAWAAGLFEGEGCFTLRVNKNDRRYADASVQMTDEDVVREFANVVGFGTVRGPEIRGCIKPRWAWAANSSFEKTQALYAMFWPWLKARRRERGAEVLRAASLPRYKGRKCRSGRHFWANDNMYLDGNGNRHCRACVFERLSIQRAADVA